MPKTKTILLQLTLFTAALIAMLWLWNTWWLPGPHGPYRWVGMDFAPFWVGVRGMMTGADPYSSQTLLAIQKIVYGGPAQGEDPMMFVYPAWMFLGLLPLALLPYPLAALLFVSGLLTASLNFLYLLSGRLTVVFSRRAGWLTALLIGSLPFLVISVTKGQLGYLSLMALFTAWRLWPRKPLAAGAILSLALLKPTVTVLPTLAFLLWALYRRDWKFLAGFSGLLGFLLLVSLIPAGNWIPGYLGMISIKGGMPVFWSLEILPAPWNGLYAVGFLALALTGAGLARRSGQADSWLSAMILAGIALTPMRWIYDLFLGVLILAGSARLRPLASLLALLAILAPWLLIFLPEAARWNAAVIGLPLLWALTWLAIYLPAARG